MKTKYPILKSRITNTGEEMFVFFTALNQGVVLRGPFYGLNSNSFEESMFKISNKKISLVCLMSEI